MQERLMPLEIDRVERTPVLVIGAGVAGLSAALSLTQGTVLSKTAFGQGGSTAWAQGGVAAALDPDDRAADHARDTVAAGGGLVDAPAAEDLAEEGPSAIGWLTELGARFDADEAGRLLLSREGGHGARRVVHAHGDATGAEVMRALTHAVQAKAGVQLIAGGHAADFVFSEGRVAGALALFGNGERVLFLASQVILASGGACRVFARTTNPPENTGDGLAMAARAGVEVADLEFVQFHPTALDAGLDPMPLLSEALRGEGATLVNDKGKRFLEGKHYAAELAPRDFVSQAIWRELQEGRKVFLDVRKVFADSREGDFAMCRAAALGSGLDPARDLLPVSPAAHYFIGGVSVDRDGRASIEGLWTVGEAASTGVHGANRLASNSLLEGIVYGRRVGARAAQEAEMPGSREIEAPADFGQAALTLLPDVVAEMRRIMWDKVGVLRGRDGLEEALCDLEELRGPAAESLEARNLHLCAVLVAQFALQREESRGCHFRTDFPAADPAQAFRRAFAPQPVPLVGLALPEAASR
jgi:L-aspartate oxidase